MNVTDLPNDILISLPHYLYCIDDWYAVIRTCRRFYHACATTKATFPAFFARRFTKGSLPVHLDLLMAGSIRQVSNWAVKSEENRQELWDAITMEADEGLIKLGVEIARWNVDEVRAIHEADVKIIEPLCEAIEDESELTHKDHCFSSPRLDDEDDLECGLCTQMDWMRTSLYNFVIYCNLFHADIEEAYGHLPLNVRPLGSAFRLHWMGCRIWRMYVPSASIFPHPPTHHELQNRFQEPNILSQFHFAGLYLRRSQTNLGALRRKDDQSRSRLNLMSELSEYGWRRLRACFTAQSDLTNISPEEDQSRFKLFHRIMSHQGLDTLRLLLPNGVPPSDTASICSKIGELPLEQVSNKPVWESRDRRTWKQIGWHSIECDEREHRRQSRYE